jgi:hypothetical protein
MSSLNKRANALSSAYIRSLTDAELEALAAGAPEIDFADFSTAELEALIYGNTSPALEKKYLDARSKAECQATANSNAAPELLKQIGE